MSIYDKFKELLNLSDSDDEEVEEVSSSSAEEKPFYKSPIVWVAGIGSFLLAKSLFAGGEKRYTIRGNMYLTKNFRVGEFLRSSSIPELKEYKLTKSELSNLKRLATVLQSFRDDIGAPIIITSGGRPPQLKATQGEYKGMSFVEILRAKNYSPSETSQHMDFSACDFTTNNKEWLVRIMESFTNVYYSSSLGKTIMQVILYIDNGQPDFIHLGVSSDSKNFVEITAGKRLLLAEVITERNLDGSRKSAITKFHKYTVAKMNELLK